MIVVGVVAGVAAEAAGMDGQEFSGKLRDEVLRLALQHSYQDHHGRSGVE
jgi:hypothetical protein